MQCYSDVPISATMAMGCGVALRLQIYFYRNRNIHGLENKQFEHMYVTPNLFYCGMCFENVKNISITIPGSDPRAPPDRPAARH